MEYESIRCELNEGFCTRNEGSAKPLSPEGKLLPRKYGDLPGRRIFQTFKRPPQEMHPHVRGESPPSLPAWGGLANPLLLSCKSLPSKLAAVKIPSTGSSINSTHTAKPTATGGECNRAQARSPKPIFGCVFVPVCSASCNAYLHARSDHSNPQDPTHHPTAATLDPPNALCLA